MAQVEYRLAEECGCDRGLATSPSAASRTPRLAWIGGGLAEVGLVAGAAVDKDAARALMDGRSPEGRQLVKPKVAADPRSLLPAGALVDAVHAAARARDSSTRDLLGMAREHERLGRLERALEREQDRRERGLPTRETTVSYTDMERLTHAAGLTPEAVYRHLPAAELAQARKYQDHRVRVGNLGYDLTLDLPKSLSALFGLAPAHLAQQLEDTAMDAVRETVAAMEQWTAYGLTGHHGHGKTAERVQTSGLLGWTTIHHAARPVAGEAGDPHLHVHTTIANLVRGTDGKWRTVAAGGRDLHRHALAADALVKARLRELTERRFGMRWERDPSTGAWEVTGVPTGLRRAFSRRAAQIADAAGPDASRRTQKRASRTTAQMKLDLIPQAVREAWHDRAAAAGHDPAAVLREAIPGPPEAPPTAAPGPPGDVPSSAMTVDHDEPPPPDPAWVAARIWRRDGPLVGHRKAVRRADVLAAVIDTCPTIASHQQAEYLTDAVLALPGEAVGLFPTGPTHFSNSDRYTHRAILTAEDTVRTSVARRMNTATGALTDDHTTAALAAFENERGFTLSTEQATALRRLLTAGHGVDTVLGVAGAGKTTIMAAARTAWQHAGLRTAGAATAAVAAAGLAAESGIASRTIASWLHQIRDGQNPLAEVDVLVVDEAAMVDDRDLAELLTHAEGTGTKVVAIGDWQQLKAVGVGGTFRAIHEQLGGAELNENRRQRSAGERIALQAWRDGQQQPALQQLAGIGRVHAVTHPDDAYAQILRNWNTARTRWRGDPHGLLAGLLVLAPRNADVDSLNAAARALLRRSGELTSAHTFALRNGRALELATGDLVRMRHNDYRSRTGIGPDVLNGFRGVVRATDPHRGALIEWRRKTPTGPTTEQGWITPQQITDGALSHGYAMTIAAAQGLTADIALLYGPGAGPNALYSGITRGKQSNHLWLTTPTPNAPSDVGPRQRVVLGGDPTAVLRRAIDAYAIELAKDGPDRLVSPAVDPDTPPSHPSAPLVPPRLPDPALRQAALRAARAARAAADEAAALAAQRGTDRSPAARRHADRLTRLHQAEDHLRKAEAANHAAQAATTDLDRDREALARTDRSLNARFTLPGRRTTLRQTHADLTAAIGAHSDLIHHLTTQATTHRRAATRLLADLAPAPKPAGDPQAHAHHVRNQLPDLLALDEHADTAREQQLRDQAATLAEQARTYQARAARPAGPGHARPRPSTPAPATASAQAPLGDRQGPSIGA
ncbi:MobF family relaxase [Streptomyces bohaiensis]|uniref:MobF family relaxase n=1 Tax=Streptomyces bohaiensis TaxID=1431344 RepID=UPI003B823598